MPCWRSSAGCCGTLAWETWRTRTLLWPQNRGLWFYKSLDSYQLNVRGLCFQGMKMWIERENCPGAPNWTLAPGFAVRSQQGKPGKPQGASQSPWLGSYQREIPSEWGLGDSQVRGLWTLHKALHERQLILKLCLNQKIPMPAHNSAKHLRHSLSLICLLLSWPFPSPGGAGASREGGLGAVKRAEAQVRREMKETASFPG